MQKWIPTREICQKEKILSWHEWRKHRHSIKVNVKEAKRSKNSRSAQHYFPSHKSSDLKMRPCCLRNSEAWLQASQTDQLTAFNKTTADLIMPQRKQEEKCSGLTTLSSSTPPHTAGFCTRACRKIRFLNHVNNNKEKLTLFCFISKEAFPSHAGGLALVPLSWAVSGVSLTTPPRMETPCLPGDLSQGCSLLQGKVCFPAPSLNHTGCNLGPRPLASPVAAEKGLALTSV